MNDLQVRALTLRFGGLKAIDGFDLTVGPGEIVALIGPNGAGKSSAFNCISRFYRPNGGQLRFGAHDLLSLGPSEVLHLGIVRTFQNMELFRGLTVLDNVLVGFHRRLGLGFLDAVFHTPRQRQVEAEARAEALGILERLGIAGVADQFPGDLPFGTQKRVELARALVSHPQLLLLDEPTAGLSTPDKAAVGDLLRELRRERGMAVLVVEHDMGFVLPLSDRVAVMNFGVKIAEGSPDEIRRHPEVVRAYLGEAV